MGMLQVPERVLGDTRHILAKAEVESPLRR